MALAYKGAPMTARGIKPTSIVMASIGPGRKLNNMVCRFSVVMLDLLVIYLSRPATNGRDDKGDRYRGGILIVLLT